LWQTGKEKAGHASEQAGYGIKECSSLLVVRDVEQRSIDLLAR
jgi:hypothetical protein